MKIAELLFLLQWVALSAAIALICFKFLYLAIAPKSKTLFTKSKWFGGSQFQELKQMNGPRLLEMMEQNKRITTAMWVCIVLCAGLFMVNGRL